MEKAIDYFKRSAELNNKNGLYEYGKVLLLGEFIPQNTGQSVKMLEKAIALENKNAKRFLALEYISGEHLEHDVDKGLAMLAECADSGDKFACYKLGKIYLSGELVEQDLDKAEKYLLLSDDNEFAQYALGKLYLQNEKYDIHKAVEYFEKSAEKNSRASFQLGRIYLFGVNGLEKDKEKAVEWLTKSANDGNEYAQNMLNHIDDFENAMLANTVFNLFVNLSRCIEDDYNQKFKSGRASVDRRLRRMILEKKKALGIKEEHGIEMT
jgi:TPR repeat protein